MKKDPYENEPGKDRFGEDLEDLWQPWSRTDEQVRLLIQNYANAQNELICIEQQLEPFKDVIPPESWTGLHDTFERMWKLLEQVENCPANVMMQNKPDTERGKTVISGAYNSWSDSKEEIQKKYDAVRKAMREFHDRSSSVSFTECRKQTASELKVSEGAAKKNIKKSDFPDW